MYPTAALPIPSVGAGLSRYLTEIKKFPILTPEEEFTYAKRWREHGDRDAAYCLVTSHLRLVAKIAMRYRGYGLPVADIVSEGNVGLMQAVKRFDPDRGVRLATYAMWWIKATIQEYVLRSWSLVKIAGTATQKKLFFKLRRTKNAISALQDGDLRPEQVKLIAEHLEVPEREVADMNGRLRPDVSLSAPMHNEGETGDALDYLVDIAPTQELRLAEEQEATHRHRVLNEALQTLNPRQRHIFVARHLTDDPLRLETLAAEYGISRERVRQIELRAFQKVKAAIQATAGGPADRTYSKNTKRPTAVSADVSGEQRRTKICLTKSN
ncbi:RNA polymerase sigma factor RpoH [Bradyrhizobium sp. JYMT SZCCT0180]|uniref:RNA polymerase sigma factor RpoH n=1 Tax=Bradyrhizobium sp. JYMT SZCCT0180 TaxID=2807666 RepID=UPI001BA91B72|nr:RNA polymerase sigma factor RpoH [Bradyrhizobium sp. JYMT SZCCT0180]MBR1216231.1 RNA polymerase sigma factor RpoH [Bradyrhizobium sp. JYMT SZCCT0180]